MSQEDKVFWIDLGGTDGSLGRFGGLTYIFLPLDIKEDYLSSKTWRRRASRKIDIVAITQRCNSPASSFPKIFILLPPPARSPSSYAELSPLPGFTEKEYSGTNSYALTTPLRPTLTHPPSPLILNIIRFIKCTVQEPKHSPNSSGVCSPLISISLTFACTPSLQHFRNETFRSRKTEPLFRQKTFRSRKTEPFFAHDI